MVVDLGQDPALGHPVLGLSLQEGGEFFDDCGHVVLVRGQGLNTTRTTAGHRKASTVHPSTVYQTILVYSSPVSAEFRYFLSQPRLAQRGDHPGFASPREPFKRASADRGQVVCATRDVDNCQIWFYWAHDMGSTTLKFAL